MRYTVKQYLEHCHNERNHQGLDNVIPFHGPGVGADSGTVNMSERLGMYKALLSGSCLAVCSPRHFSFGS